jgi:hypothetical protein
MLGAGTVPTPITCQVRTVDMLRGLPIASNGGLAPSMLTPRGSFLPIVLTQNRGFEPVLVFGGFIEKLIERAWSVSAYAVAIGALTYKSIERPHSAMGYISSAAYAATLAATSDRPADRLLLNPCQEAPHFGVGRVFCP